MEEDTRGWWHLLIHKPDDPTFQEKVRNLANRIYIQRSFPNKDNSGDNDNGNQNQKLNLLISIKGLD